MFIKVTIDKVYVSDEGGKWKAVDPDRKDQRINIADVSRYWQEGKYCILILKQREFSPSVIAVTNTIAEIDAMVGAVNEKAAKILFSGTPCE